MGAGQSLENLPIINVGSFLEALVPEGIPLGYLKNAPHGLALSLLEGSKVDKVLLVQAGRMGLTGHLARWLVPNVELCATWVRPRPFVLGCALTGSSSQGMVWGWGEGAAGCG